MRQQRNIFQMKAWDKIQELSEAEIVNLPTKEFKIIFGKMLKEFKRR